MSNPFLRKNTNPNAVGSVLDRALSHNPSPPPNASQPQLPIPNEPAQPNQNQPPLRQNIWTNLPQFPKNHNNSSQPLRSVFEIRSAQNNPESIPNLPTANPANLPASSTSSSLPTLRVQAPSLVIPPLSQTNNTQTAPPGNSGGRGLFKAKILQKRGQAIGQFNFSQDMIFNSNSSPRPSEITLSQSYRQRVYQDWKNTITCNNLLNLNLNENWQKILIDCQRNGLSGTVQKPGVIIRLREGFRFYDYDACRSQFASKIIEQNKQTNTNPQICQNIEKIQRTNQVDFFLCYYFMKSVSNYELQNPKNFINEDRLNLIKMYSLLWKNKHQSCFMQIFKNKPQNYLRQSIQHYLGNYIRQSKAHNTELGLELINLLIEIVTIRNQTDFINVQQLQLIAHQAKQISKMIKQNEVLRQKTNVLFIQLYCRSDGMMQSGLSEEVEAFVDYYIKNINQTQSNPEKLKAVMNKLALYQQYGKQTAPKVANKIELFIERNKAQQENIRPGQLIIAMEAVLLLKQMTKLHNKENNNKYLDELLHILYQHSPLFVLNYKSNDRPLNQLILPLVCRYGQSQYISTDWVGIQQLNSSIPESYQFASRSINYLLAQHLLQLLDQQASESSLTNRQNLQDIQETLSKFGARSNRRATGQDQNNQQLMITKYILKYTEAFANEYTFIFPKKNSILVDTPQEKQYIIFLLQSLLQAIQNLTKIYDKFNKQANASSFFNFEKMLGNIRAISKCIPQSGLIPMNEAYQAFYYKNQQEKCYYLIKMDVKSIYKKIVSSLINLSSKHNNEAVILAQTLATIYSDWQNAGDHQNAHKFILLLLTITALSKFKLNDDKRRRELEKIDKLKKGVNMGTILKQIIAQSLDKKQRNHNNPSSQIIKLGLSALSLYLLSLSERFEDKGSKFQPQNSNMNRVSSAMQQNNFVALMCKYGQSIIKLTIDLILEIANEPSNSELVESYCQLIRLIIKVSIQNSQGQPNQVLNQAAKLYKSSNRIHLFALCVDQETDSIQTEEQTKIYKMIDVVFASKNKSDAYKQIQLADIAVNYDEKLLQKIIEEQYLPNVCSSLLTILDKLTENKDRVIETDLSQAIRSMNIYSKLFLGNFGVTMDQFIVSRFIKSIRFIFSHKKEFINASELSTWAYLVIASIGNKLSSVHQFQMFVSEVIQIIADNVHILHDCPNSFETCIRITQFMMIYTKKMQAIFKAQKQNSTAHIANVIKIVGLILEVLANPATNQKYSLSYDHQLQRWLKCAIVITLKISQFINTKTITDKSFGDIRNEASQTVKIVNTLIQSNSALDRLQESVQKQLKSFLMSVAELLTLDELNTSGTNYRNYNQTLINVAMINKQSYRSCFIGLAQEILKPASNRHRNNDTIQDKYRSYYLFYYFLKKHIDDELGKYVRLMFNEESGSHFKCQIDQSIFSIINQLVYYLSQSSDNRQSKLDKAWKTIILHRLLKTRVELLRTNKFTIKVLQFCLRNLQQRTNQSEYLNQWVVYTQTIGVIYLIFKTHSHCDQISSGDILILDKLRARIYKQVEEHILKWSRIKDNQNIKITKFSIEPIEITSAQKNQNKVEDNKSYKKLKNNLKDFKFSPISQKVSNKNAQTQNMEEKVKEDEISVWDYLKITMTLCSTSLFLNYYRLDTMMVSAIDGLFWSKLMQFCQQILKQYGKINDRYFGDKRVKSQVTVDKIEGNRRILQQGLHYYIKDVDLTNNQYYVNKIMGQYIIHQLSFKKIINNNLDMSQNLESAFKWCCDIQQSLTAFGVKGDKRFYPENNKSASLKMSGKSRKF